MATPQLKTEVHAGEPRVAGRGLTAAEERRLARRWRATEDRAALGQLVAAHIGLVIKIATQFRHSGPALEDLIQEGHVGLTIAATRFDPAEGTRLATYATYWIRACMMEFVVRSHGPVRIGTTRAQRKIFFGLGRARRAIERTGQPVTTEALATSLGVAECEVDAMAPRLSGSDLSLDAPRNVSGDRDVGAFLPEGTPSPEELVGNEESADLQGSSLRQALKILDKREREIIRARHLSEVPVTLDELGKRLRVSRERVRQIETRAVAKLRAACRASSGVSPSASY